MASKWIGPPRPFWPRIFSRSCSSRPRRVAFWPGGVTLVLALIVAVLGPIAATAQIQQAWVAHYNNGILNGTNQAVKMALDSAGNIYITGFSQNTNTNLGYVTIKYAPNGNQLWASRFDSTNSPSAAPAGMVLDNSNDVIVTGSALTVKYDPNGNQLWTAPYAGTALAVDTNANIYVAGFSQNFGTEKLSPQGSNVWLTTFVESYGPTVSQSVLVDGGNNVYVSGLDSYYSFINNGMLYGPFVTLTTIKYGSNGNQIWKTSEAPTPENINLQVEGATLDSSNSVFVVVSFFPSGDVFLTYKLASNGALNWTASNPDASCGGDLAHGLAIGNTGEVFVTGQSCYFAPNDSYATFVYGTYKASTNGAWVWTNTYPTAPMQPSIANAIAVDMANSVYVTGSSPDTNTFNDIVTIKYDPNGNQVWLQRYTSPGNGNAAGNAIAVDNNGNVYVTGYDTTTAGGTEIVTIKYSPVTVQRRSDGTVILQAQGSPGESFDIQASADLLNWLDLGPATADTNGLMQFADTNASNFTSRFYYTNPQ
jgi:hypothetical protein